MEIRGDDDDANDTNDANDDDNDDDDDDDDALMVPLSARPRAVLTIIIITTINLINSGLTDIRCC